MDTQTLDAATVDSFMGSGWFNGYTKVAEEDFLFEQERAMENIKWFASIWHAGTRSQLEYDLECLELVQNDLIETLLGAYLLARQGNLSAAKAIAPKIDRLYEVLGEALNVMTIENWMLKDMADAGVVKMLATVSLNQIREKAAAAMKSMLAIEVEFRKAHQLKQDSMSQLKVNTLIAVLGPLLIPGGAISILAGGVIAAGQIILDDKWGASTSTLATRGSQAATTLGAYAGALGEVMTAEGKQAKALLAGRSVKGLALVGIAFDINEIFVADANFAVLEKKFKTAIDDWNNLVDKVDLYDEKFAAIELAVKRAREESRKRRLDDLPRARQSLVKVAKSAGYSF